MEQQQLGGGGVGSGGFHGTSGIESFTTIAALKLDAQVNAALRTGIFSVRAQQICLFPGPVVVRTGGAADWNR